MAKLFKNEKDLERFLLEKCKAVIAETENKIYADIKSVLVQFYQEFTPDEYIRTRQLLHSLVKSNIKKTRNGYEAEVYFDAGLMDYEKGVVQTQHGTGYATWSGETVLNVAMDSNVPHGGYASGTSVWPVSMDKIGNVWKLLEQKLRAQGIPIK